jgi:hypothetical protein
MSGRGRDTCRQWMKHPAIVSLTCWLLVASARVSAADISHGLDGIWLIENAPKAVRTIDGRLPPLLPAAKAQYERQLKARRRGDTSFDKTTWCAAAGVPRLMLEPYPFEILVNPRQTAFMYEWNRWARLVDMTGNDLQPLYPLNFGTANGHFEGDVLVIVTKGLTKDTYLDHSGLPHSDNMVLTERLRRIGPGIIEDRMRIEDPDTYSSPWETLATYQRQSYDRLKEDVCLDRIEQGRPAI